MYKHITYTGEHGKSYWNPVSDQWEKNKVAMLEKYAIAILPKIQKRFGEESRIQIEEYHAIKA